MKPIKRPPTPEEVEILNAFFTHLARNGKLFAFNSSSHLDLVFWSKSLDLGGDSIWMRGDSSKDRTRYAISGGSRNQRWKVIFQQIEPGKRTSATSITAYNEAFFARMILKMNLWRE